MLFTVIARVPFTSPRIRRSIQDRSILMLNIIGFVMCLSQSNCIWRKSDMLTKCLPGDKLEACRLRTGLVKPTT